jgi:hypothetical protein
VLTPDVYCHGPLRAFALARVNQFATRHMRQDKQPSRRAHGGELRESQFFRDREALKVRSQAIFSVTYRLYLPQAPARRSTSRCVLHGSLLPQIALLATRRR